MHTERERERERKRVGFEPSHLEQLSLLDTV
jgi:hypothetical protein